MKGAFLFHARRILERLNPGRTEVALKSSGQADKEAGLVDEISRRS